MGYYVVDGVQVTLCCYVVQILFLVGIGKLKPDIGLTRTDVPKAFKRLFQDCIKFLRDERPLFPQVELF